MYSRARKFLLLALLIGFAGGHGPLQSQTNFISVFNFNVGGVGAAPQGLVKGMDGAFYGTTSRGGRYNGGTFFKFEEGATDIQVLQDFPVELSPFPNRRIMQGSDGFFYGKFALDYGGPTRLFRIARDGSGYQILRQINSRTVSPLTEGRNGNLFGTIWDGGTNRTGAIFSLKKDGADFQIIHEFTSQSEGQYPSSRLVLGEDDWLFGLTARGGGDGAGVLFKISESGQGYTVQSSFPLIGTNRSFPGNQALMEASDGFLYGSINRFIPSNYYLISAVLFRIQKHGGGFTIIKDSSEMVDAPFATADCSELFEATDGRIYGTFPAGGDYGGGVLFKIDKDTLNFSVARHFKGGLEGAYPDSHLVESGGKLYGVTRPDAPSERGILFRLALNGTEYEVVRHFSANSSGISPHEGTLLTI